MTEPVPFGDTRNSTGNGKAGLKPVQTVSVASRRPYAAPSPVR
jgi:hypothetical protein